jgi:hypothetical protein
MPNHFASYSSGKSRAGTICVPNESIIDENKEIIIVTSRVIESHKHNCYSG